MKGLIAVLCIAALLGNGVAFAGGNTLRMLQRGLAAPSQEAGKKAGKLGKWLGKAKQFGAGIVLAGVLTCGTLACTKDEVANSLQEQQSRVATLDYEQNATLKEILAGLELAEDAQIGIVKNDKQDLLMISNNNGTVYLQLSEGEMLVNNASTPLKVILSEEVVDEGWIAEGSWFAITPAGLVALGGLTLTGMAIFGALVDPIFDAGAVVSGLEVIGIGALGSLLTSATSYGTYHLLLLL